MYTPCYYTMCIVYLHIPTDARSRTITCTYRLLFFFFPHSYNEYIGLLMRIEQKKGWIRSFFPRFLYPFLLVCIHLRVDSHTDESTVENDDERYCDGNSFSAKWESEKESLLKRRFSHILRKFSIFFFPKHGKEIKESHRLIALILQRILI